MMVGVTASTVTALSSGGAAEAVATKARFTKP